MRSPRIDYLKGFAIAAILINHYLNEYISGNHSGYANGVAALFFLVAGYLSYFSLEKKHKMSSSKTIAAFKFYISRIIRIHPLYWLTLIPVIYYHGQITFLDFTALAGNFWFITALLHGYIFCFLFYLLLKKLKPSHYLIILSLSFIALNLYYSIGSAQNFIIIEYVNKIPAITYRGLFLAHVFLVGLGMAVPFLTWKQKHVNKFKDLFFFIILFILVFLTRNIFDSLVVSKIISLLFVFGLFIIFLFFIKRKGKLFFTPILSLLGKYTLSLYLFHLFFFITLEYFGIIRKDSIISIISTVFLFLPFFALCIFLEKYYSKLSIHLNKKLTAS